MDVYSVISHNILLASVVSLISFTLVCAHFYFKNVYSYWEKKGVRGPKPWPIVGNFLTLLVCNRMETERKWVREYGKVYGIYQGSTPRLVIADPEILLQVCVKDFDVFPNHVANEFSNELGKNFLFTLEDEHWKKVRVMLSPTFTSGKIRRMFKFLDACADDLVQCFHEQLNHQVLASGQDKLGRQIGALEGVVNLKETYNLYTMDAITTCCYGLKLERAGSANLKTAATRNDLVGAAMKIFEFRIWRMLVGAAVPKPILRMVNFEFAPEKNLIPLLNKVKKVIYGRRQSAKKFDDYLQLLLDAKLDDQMELGEMDLVENHHAGLTRESLLQDQSKMVGDVYKSRTAAENRTTGQQLTLSDLEILSSAVFLLAVGLETTGTLLANCSYTLAFHQDIQKRLHKELSNIVEYNEDKSKFSFDYEKVTSCRYLDSVLSESLRFMSPIIMVDRSGNREYRIEKYNIDLPKGAALNLGLYAVGNDPDYWPEPHVFNPERFMPGNKDHIVPGSYCPFGLGPRHCIGMRFSLTEAKLALAKVIMHYRFEPAPNTKFPPEPKRSIGFNNMEKPIVKLVKRKVEIGV